ncbi:MAG: ABC transporter permease, partial [bacterium]
MRQFGAIFSFELSKFFKNRTYLIVTAILLTVALAATFVPRVIALFRGGSGGEAPAEGETMLVAGLDLTEELALWFPDYTLQYCDEAELKEKVASGEAACGVVVKAEDVFTYYVENLSLYDENAATLEEAMRERLRTARLTALGLSPEESGEILYPALTSEVVSLGVDQRMNFAYTYIMIIALYMVILLYGQMVATNVAGEKSSRAMELLITTADPVAMMFGKVMASGLAGLVQLLAAFGAALFGYGFNREAWLGLTFGESFFDIPPALLGYMLF